MAKNKHPQRYTAGPFGEILTARPEGMSYQKYREERKAQTLRLRHRRQYGFIVWKSKCISILNDRGEKVPGGESWGTLTGPVPTLTIQ